MTTRWKHYAGIALKTLSWRATAGIDTFVLTFLITGNLAAAAAVAGTESFTKFALFYGHEWLATQMHARNDQNRIGGVT